jgi:UDP-glucose 4-epimerase
MRNAATKLCGKLTSEERGCEMNILITGGAGYIGSHTTCELLAQGHNVVACDNFANSKPGLISRLKKLAAKDFVFHQMDVRDEARLDHVFSTYNIDCVIHFAGLKAAPESVSAPLLYYENNLNSTIALCRAMKKHDIRKVIFSSSATIYSANNKMPLTEESQIGDCLNPYGYTKLMCEQIIRDVASSNAWAVVLLRYFNPIGAHESGEIGEDPQGIPNNLMPYISQVAIGKLEHLNIYGDDYDTPDGTGIRDYMHVMDLAKGHVAALKYLDNLATGTDVFNLGTGKGTSVLELVNSFEQVTGVVIPKKVVGRRSGDVAVCYANAKKAEIVLGWKTEKTIEQACADSWNWQNKVFSRKGI